MNSNLKRMDQFKLCLPDSLEIYSNPNQKEYFRSYDEMIVQHMSFSCQKSITKPYIGAKLNRLYVCA